MMSVAFLRFRLVAILLAALALMGVVAVQAQQPDPLQLLPAWGVVPSPNGGTGPNDLLAVEAISSTDIWAVGSYGGYLSPNPAIHHWDGVAWHLSPLPDALPAGVLTDVSAVASDDVWAVGYAQSGGDSLILHWDGTEWSTVPHPTPYTRQGLRSVSARAANDVWATGDYSINGGVSLSYSLHWDGTAWAIVEVPSPNGGYSTLNDVLALAADEVWAVGDDGPSPVAMRWNGSSWQSVAIPGGTNAEYVALSATSPSDIWAVGKEGSSHLVARWNGSAWSQVAQPFSGYGRLEDVVAIAPNDAWIVGWAGFQQALALHWNGTAWTIQSPDPTAQANRSFNSVAAISTNEVWAVGEQQASLVARWDGSDWQDVPSSNVSNADNELADIDGDVATGAWAVGSAGNEALALRWNGSQWQLQPVPTPTNTELKGVSTLSATDAWAVGLARETAGGTPSTVALRWDGSTWQRVTTPNPSPSSPNILNSVLAFAPDDAWAVGESADGALILRWDGSNWQVVPNSCVGALRAIHGLDSSTLWAVGDSTCRYDGSTWSNVTPPSSPYLSGVHVISASEAWAVGTIIICGAQSCSSEPYAARWDGSAWARVPIFLNSQALPGALSDVYASGPNDVWVVGTYSVGTAILHWDGTAWQSVPPPDPDNGGDLVAISDNGQGGYWAAGYSYDSSYRTDTLIVDAPSATQGSVYGYTGYDDATVTWIGAVNGSTISDGVPSRYGAAALPAGSYTFIATGPGCTPQVATVQVVAGEHVRQDFDLCGPQPTPVPTRTATPTPGAQGLMLQPAAVSLTVPANGSQMQMVALHNMTTTPMAWNSYEAGSSCNAPADLPWLDVTPMSGSLPANGMTELMVHVDMMGMPGNSYSGYLCLSDDHGHTEMLPISVTVGGGTTLYLPLVTN